MNGVNTGKRTVAGYLVITLTESLSPNVNQIAATAINNDGERLTSNVNIECCKLAPKGIIKKIPAVTKTFAIRLKRVLDNMSQKLRCPIPDAGLFGITLIGPTRRKFVNPYEALITDVTSEVIPRGSMKLSPFLFTVNGPTHWFVCVQRKSTQKI